MTKAERHKTYKDESMKTYIQGIGIALGISILLWILIGTIIWSVL